MRAESSYVELESDGVPIRAWVRGVDLAQNALQQLRNTARLSAVLIVVVISWLNSPSEI